MQAVFLFTDIVGSTVMWERDTDAMDRAMNIHDEVLRSLVAEFNGEVFKHTGDGICAAFNDAAVALQAAVEGQLHLIGVPWPGPASPQVRMALHFGTFREHAGDYFGFNVCLARRILDLAPGGSVLITEPAVARLSRQRLERVWLLDMGRHRLRSITTPVRVFRVLSFPTDDRLDLTGVA